MSSASPSLGSKCWKIVKIALIFLPCVCMCIGLLLSLVLISPYRALVWLITKIFRRDLEGFVTGISTSFTLGKTNEILAIGIIGGILTEEEIHEDFEEKVLSRNEFQRLKYFWENFLGYPFWKKEKDFSVRTHVRYYDYAGPLYLPDNPKEKDIENLAGDLVNLEFRAGESPWEILIVRNFNGIETAIVVRVDHVLGDAFSGLEILKKLSGSELRVPKFKLMERSFTKLEKFGLVFKAPKDFLVDAVDNGSVKKLPINCEEESNHGARAVFGPKIPVELIKSIKNHYKVNYNVVINAAISRALSRGLQEVGSNVPEKFTATVIIPKPNHPEGISNHTLFAIADFPLGSGREEILKEIQSSFETISQSATPLLTSALAELITFFPTCWTPKMFWTVAPLFMPNVLISSFPVFISEDFYRGLRIRDMFVITNSLQKNWIIVEKLIFFLFPYIFFKVMCILAGGFANQQRVCFFMDKGAQFSEEMFQHLGEYFLEEIQMFAQDTLA